MTTYALRKDTQDQAKKSFIKFIPLVVLASLPALIMAFAMSGDAPYLIYFMVIMLIAAITIAYFLGQKRRPTFLLTVDEVGIKLHRSGNADVMIRRDEVKTISDEDAGLRVRSIDPTDEIFIPKDVENYESLKTELGSWILVEKGEQNKFLQIGGLIGVIVIFLGMIVFKEKVFVYLFLALLAGYVIYLYSRNFKSMLVTKDKWKRIRIIGSFIIFGFIIVSYLLRYLR